MQPLINGPLDDESELLLQMKHGQVSAFDVIYHHYSSGIYKNILRLVKQDELAKEILQEVFLKVWQKRETLNVEVSFKSYLFKIAHNLVIDMFRRAAFDRELLSHLSLVSTELYSNTDEATDLKDTELLLSQAIDALPAQRKKVYLLCKIEGKSYQQVSELLGISTATVRDHIVKATKTVKSHFPDQDFHIIMAAIAISFYK
jgi:RNA polymerase sigma-70 factor (family 1)